MVAMQPAGIGRRYVRKVIFLMFLSDKFFNLHWDIKECLAYEAVQFLVCHGTSPIGQLS